MTNVPEKTRGVSTYDWETGATTYDVTQMDSGQRFRCALSQATEAARKRFPHSMDRIAKAWELASEGKVVLHPKNKTATVTSSDGKRAYTVNGHCECPDATRAPEGVCKHKFAALILRKALVLVKEFAAATSPVTVPAAVLHPEDEDDDAVGNGLPATEETEPAAVLEAEVVPFEAPRTSVPSQFVSSIKGKPFVQFAGLLTVAHGQGLLSLTERVTHVTDTYVMAEARAEFEDGRVFVGVGDSSPENVGKEVQPHWRRLAGTRAMARALRQALNISMCSVEELD